jgi:Zn-dependent protease
VHPKPQARSRPGVSPVFAAVVALGVLGGVLCWSDERTGTLPRVGVFLLVAAGWVVSLCFHEFSHAFAAYLAGDTDVEAAGYLSLNPFRYAHPVLSIALPLIFIVQGGIGLPGGAVYLHPHAFRSRWQQSLAAAVGPAVNAALAVVLLLVVRSHATAHLQFWSGIAFLGFLQISAAILNLLPIPGLDGYAIIEPYLSRETTRSLAPVKAWGMLGVFVLLQVRQLNVWFFEAVQWLYDRSGAPTLLWQLGYQLFKFWNR